MGWRRVVDFLVWRDWTLIPDNVTLLASHCQRHIANVTSEGAQETLVLLLYGNDSLAFFFFFVLFLYLLGAIRSVILFLFLLYA